VGVIQSKCVLIEDPYARQGDRAHHPDSTVSVRPDVMAKQAQALIGKALSAIKINATFVLVARISSESVRTQKPLRSRAKPTKTLR
jgi:hypothetical protein